jgi:CheY-like chemotaxis protein
MQNENPNSILIIEDDDTFRAVLNHVLVEEGYKVITASNGLKAINILKKETPDLIITDIIMELSDGIEIIMHVKKNYPTCKIIAVSGGGRGNADEYLDAAYSLGADHILTKPFLLPDLVITVNKLLQVNDQLVG